MIGAAKPKVVVVNQPWNPALPPVQSGSVAIWIFETARRIADRYEVVAVAPQVKGVPVDARHQGVRCLRLPTWPEPHSLTSRLLAYASPRPHRAPAFARTTYYGRYIRAIGVVVAQEKPAVVHIHNLLQIAPVVRAAYRTTRIVLHMHCDWLVQLPQDVVMECVDTVDYVVGCSEYIGQAASKRFPSLAGRTGVLYNGVDLAGFSGDGPSTEPVVLWVGRITPEKGLHTLIDAFTQVAMQVPEAQLKIAGPHSLTSREFLIDISPDERVRELASFYDDSYLRELQARIPTKYRDRVHFLGFIPHEELPALYREARVVANPSFSESFGMSLIEAMACGIPVVATRIGGMTDVVDDGINGLMVEPGDVGELANALSRLLLDGNTAQKFGDAGRLKVSGRYGWSQISDQLARVYGDLANSGQ